MSFEDRRFGKSEQRAEITPLTKEQFMQLYRQGVEIARKYPEAEQVSARIGQVIGILLHSFNGDLKGKKIIDVAAGSAALGSAGYGVDEYSPMLAHVLQQEGAEVLAIDKVIAVADKQSFTAQEIDLRSFSTDDIAEAWQQSDAVVSTSFIGQPSDEASVDSLDLALQLAAVAPLQIHTTAEVAHVHDGEDAIAQQLRQLQTPTLTEHGFTIVYNSLDDPDSTMGVVAFVRDSS